MDSKERIPAVKITDNETGETYELDFNRESTKFIARQGFVVDASIIDCVADKGEEFWYYAFRANHRKMARNQTDKLLQKVGGLSPKLILRLIDLHNQALESNNIIQDDEDLKANPRVTVEWGTDEE